MPCTKSSGSEQVFRCETMIYIHHRGSWSAAPLCVITTRARRCLSHYRWVRFIHPVHRVCARAVLDHRTGSSCCTHQLLARSAPPLYSMMDACCRTWLFPVRACRAVGARPTRCVPEPERAAAVCERQCSGLPHLRHTGPRGAIRVGGVWQRGVCAPAQVSRI